MKALIVRTGVANVASIAAALRRCGLDPEITADPGAVRESEIVILPGVGSFGAGMGALRRSGLDDALIDRINTGRATLAVCLGLQLFASESEETPGVRGLGVIDANIARFPRDVRTPQFGWNRVETDSDPILGESGYAYYANSYRLTEVPPGWNAAWSEHGGRFVGALRRGPVVACQFHPELSGKWGLGLIRRWVASAKEMPSC
ncbi:MAG: imidazole glycerol phosphate synthase subunit HisH [Phycisphaerales bacterium]